MEYSTTGSPLHIKTMSIDPNKELFDSSAPPPASSPPATPAEDPDEAREREIEGGGAGDGGTLVLSVTDPQQIGEGRNATTFYRIDVRQGHYSSDPIASVRRRYSDFQWLFQRLHAEKPGAIVPIIPHKQAVSKSKRLSEELIEERRVHLERFLGGVQVHPELEGAPSLAAFFSPDAEVFEAAKKANPGNGSGENDSDDTSSPTKKTAEKVKHFFVKAGVKVKVARGGELEETRDGAQMEEVESYLSTLESHVKALSKATLYLVSVSKDTSTTMHELGQSLFGLHQTYDPESAANSNADSEPPTHASNLPSMKTISTVFASLSAVNKVKSDENQSKVGTPMNELEWSIKAAHLSIKRRKNCQLEYNTYLQQIKNREASLEKITNAATLNPQSGSSSDSKIAEAQKLLDEGKQSAKKALKELDTVTQRVFREMDRFKRGMDEKLRKLYVSHARVQVDYSRQLDAEWGKLLPISSGGSGSGGSANGAGGAAASRSVSPSGSKEAEMLMI